MKSRQEKSHDKLMGMLAFAAIAAGIIIFLKKEEKVEKREKRKKRVGHFGTEERKAKVSSEARVEDDKFPSRYFSHYVDILLWPTPDVSKISG